MRRRDMLKFGGAAGAALALGGCGGQATDAAGAPSASTEKYSWNLALAVPSTLPIWGPGLIRFADDVRLLSGGRLDITVHGKGERHKSTDQIFTGVREGLYEMGHAAAYYWIGKSDEHEMKAAAFFTTVPFGMTATGMGAWLAHGGGQELWDELYAPLGLKALPCGNTGVQAGGWFRKPIETVADFENLKMRIPGFGGEVLAAAGGTPEDTQPGEIFQALDQGRIDATEWVGPYHDYLMKFHQAAKYYYTGGWHEPGATLELLINKKAWESLPADLKAVVRTCAAAADRAIHLEWAAKDAEYYAKLKAMPDLHVGNFPRAVTDELHGLAKEVLAGIRDQGPMAKKIHDSYTSFKDTYRDYFLANEFAYVRSWAPA